MNLKNENDTLEAMEEVMKGKQNDFHEEILERLTLEQIQFHLCYPICNEIDREEEYVSTKNILHEYLMER